MKNEKWKQWGAWMEKRSSSHTPSTVSPRCAVALCNAGDGAAEGLSNNISPLFSSRNISPGVWPQRLALPVNTGPWQTHSINQCFSHTSSLPFLKSRSYARGYCLHKHYHIAPLCHFSPAKCSAAPRDGRSNNNGDMKSDGESRSRRCSQLEPMPHGLGTKSRLVYRLVLEATDHYYLRNEREQRLSAKCCHEAITSPSFMCKYCYSIYY